MLFSFKGQSNEEEKAACLKQAGRYSKLGRSYQFVAPFQMHHQQDVLQDRTGGTLTKARIKIQLYSCKTARIDEHITI